MDRYDVIVADWKAFTIPDVVKRDLEVDLQKLKDFIITISGPRRAGKTYFMFQLIHQLLESEYDEKQHIEMDSKHDNKQHAEMNGKHDIQQDAQHDFNAVSRENILYVNLEDDRLFPFSTTDLDALLERFLVQSDIQDGQNIYLFLDEIQNIRNWESWVRRIHALRKDIRMVLTGSSSKLLSSEIATNLRGRTYNLTIFPVSFSEYQKWKGIPSVRDYPSSRRKVQLRKCFNDYIAQSSYPQLLFGEYDEEVNRNILQGYYEVMLLRDIIERYDLRQPNLLRTLGKMLFSSVAKEYSYTKLRNSLNSLGIKVSTNTIIDYINHFEDVFLFFQHPVYSSSYKTQTASVKKVYCVDTGLMNAVSFRFSEDRGKLLENVIFIELKRRGKEIFYHKRKKECDFLIKEGLEIKSAIQVCTSLSDPSTRDREIHGLVEALSAHNLKEGLILTDDEFEKFEREGFRIDVMPVWFWLHKQDSDC